MLAIERRNEIMEILQTEKRVVVSELSHRYQVSEETIRRDLEKLENDGLVTKSYGGAVLNEKSSFELPFNVRKQQQIAQKQKIAALVADMVEDGEALMLDASSTAAYIARGLKEKKRLTVVTNSVEILVELFDVPNWNIISTGGISREKSFNLVGPQTDRMIQTYHVDKAVISCKGISFDAGMTDSDEQDVSSKRMMLDAARERILAVDSSKFGKTAFTNVAKWNNITKIVTDQRPAQEWMEEFERLGIPCIYPGMDR